MKFRITLFLELTFSMFVVLLLSGCFGDGGSSAAYDGTWTAGYVDTAFVPPAAAASGAVSCGLLTIPTITIVDGIGSTTQTNRCTGTAAGTQDFIYFISVAIKASTGAVSAVVNGGSLSGTCISTHGCSAQNGTASLSLTR